MRLGSIVVGGIVCMAIGFGAFLFQTGRFGGGAAGAAGGPKGPTAIVDTVAVKTDLLTMASAMKQQFALEGRYITLAELRQRGVPVPEKRGPYVFSADVSAMDFTIKATYQPKEGETAQILTIGPDMKVK